MGPLLQQQNHQGRCRHQDWNSAPSSTKSSSPLSSIRPGVEMAHIWGLFLSGMQEGHNDHFLTFGFFLTIWTKISYSWCLAPAWQFSQNKEYRKVGDTAAVWPRDRWCSYFRSYFRRPPKKISSHLPLFLEKTVRYDLCGDLWLEAQFPSCKILFKHLAASAGPGLPNLIIPVRA